MNITMIGHSYVGLVSAVIFADLGNQVTVIGHSPEKIAKLNQGEPLIFEPGLAELLQKNLEAKRISFTLDYDPAIKDSEIVIIAVGTPSGKSGEADLTQVLSVAKSIASNLKDGYTVIACKSTVPVLTHQKIGEVVNQNKPAGAKFDLVSCPEFLREGSAIHDTKEPDRVVIGAKSKRAIDLMLELHQGISGERVITDLASAELIKYAANSILATKISFANLISFYCEKTQADVSQVLRGIGLDKRIGQLFLDPGIGYGGACFPKDVKALLHAGKVLGLDTSLLDGVEKINALAWENFADKIIKLSPGKKLAVWGLSFKPNTDDIREAPSLKIIQKLLNSGFSITAYDPEAMELVEKKTGNSISFAPDAYAAIPGADALIIMTQWSEFQQIDLDKVKQLLKNPVIFDGRNMFEPKTMHETGFTYHSVGRPTLT